MKWTTSGQLHPKEGPGQLGFWIVFCCRNCCPIMGFQTKKVRRYDWTPNKSYQKTKPENVFGVDVVEKDIDILYIL